MPDDPHISTTGHRLTGRDRLLMAVLSLALLLPGTFGVSLTDRDEGWYGQVSREMLTSGDWLTPRYLGEPWLAKPPLLYWCTAGSFAVFGVEAWAGRLVSVLAMVGAVQLLGALAAGLYGRRVAWFACVSFITAGLPLVIGKMLLTDALLLLCCLGAMWLLWRMATRGPTLAGSLGFWLCVGLAILAKGPAVVLFVGAFALGLMAWGGRGGGGLRRDSRPSGLADNGRHGGRPLQARLWVLSAKLWLASPVCLAVALPWYVYTGLHAGGTLWQQFLWQEVLSRLVSAPHGQGGPPGYHVLVALAGWLPWSALVPGAVLEVWRARREDGGGRLLLVWCLLPWLLLELIPSKLPHYALPCYVPLAIMLGRMWEVGLGRTITGRERAVLGIWAGVPVVLGAGLMAVAAFCVWGREGILGPEVLGPAMAGGVASAALLGGFVLAAWQVRRSVQAAWLYAVCATGLFHVLVGLWVLPGLEPYRLSRRVAERANALVGADAQVLVCGYEEPTVFFYLQRPARVVASEEIHAALGEGPGPRVLIVRDEELRQADHHGGRAAREDGGWQRVRGFNYVRGHRETVWIIPISGQSVGLGGPTLRASDPTGAASPEWRRLSTRTSWSRLMGCRSPGGPP